MEFMSTGINTSPTITGPSGVAGDVRGKAVKFDASGKVVLANTAGEIAIGIALISEPSVVKEGDDINIQIKEIGLAQVGAAVKKGDELAVDTEGKLQKATDNQFVLATALEAADKKDAFIRVQIVKYAKGTIA